MSEYLWSVSRKNPPVSPDCLVDVEGYVQDCLKESVPDSSLCPLDNCAVTSACMVDIFGTIFVPFLGKNSVHGTLVFGWLTFERPA